MIKDGKNWQIVESIDDRKQQDICMQKIYRVDNEEYVLLKVNKSQELGNTQQIARQENVEKPEIMSQQQPIRQIPSNSIEDDQIDQAMGPRRTETGQSQQTFGMNRSTSFMNELGENLEDLGKETPEKQ